MSDLSYVGRRVLAHLPVWHADEPWLIEQEGGPEVSIRSYSLPELTARLLEDESTPDMDEGQVGLVLSELAKAGLCEDRDGWRMTEAGYEALVDPTPPQDQEPGPAFLHLNPGRLASNAKAVL